MKRTNYRYWTLEETEKLKEMLIKGDLRPRQMAAALGRSVGQVYAKTFKLREAGFE